MAHVVYTIGHSNRSLQGLFDIIRRYNIQVIVDVRRFPTSRVVPHFRRDVLEGEASRRGLEYLWLGDLLGGYRSSGYREYMRTNNFSKGLNKLIEIAKLKTTVIMCSEKLWFKCHRRFIADKLVENGFRVIHIADVEKTYEHKVKHS